TAAKGGDATSVNGIASGIKGIVEAADGGGGAGDADKAAAAVSAVSGEQILKAIVEAAKGGDKKAGEKAEDATNPIDAAIGSAGQKDANAAAFAKDGMKKDDQIAAAGGKDNANAGKLFAKRQHAGAHGGGAAADAEKAAAAVSAVSGEQILKAIVEAAKDGREKTGEKAEDAKNPIEAAIGSADQNANAAAFDKDEMTKDDQIAAAMVLRGMAQDGQFALKNGDHDNAKGTVKNAVEMAKAAAAAASAATGGGDEAIGSVVKAAAGTAAAGGEAKSVNGIASGIKGIVEAA
ncbi:variable large family protein, partial [Borreliella valaisiana]|uniref:variable large family protein n=1 Tax=Borreliella valaisiana TaxID=62088 RepID=UPI001B350908